MYNGEVTNIGPEEWDVFEGDIVFNTNGEIVGVVGEDYDTSLLKNGSYYHAGYSDDKFGLNVTILHILLINVF